MIMNKRISLLPRTTRAGRAGGGEVAGERARLLPGPGLQILGLKLINIFSKTQGNYAKRFFLLKRSLKIETQMETSFELVTQ